MTALKILLIALIIITSVLLVLTILMHKGRGGGLSDMFGGGITSSAQSSGVAERNLNRITLVSLIVWVVCIIVYALILRYYVPVESTEESGQSSQSYSTSDTSQSDDTTQSE